MPKIRELIEDDNAERDFVLEQFAVYGQRCQDTPSECYGRNGLLTVLERSLGYAPKERVDRGRY